MARLATCLPPATRAWGSELKSTAPTCKPGTAVPTHSSSSMDIEQKGPLMFADSQSIPVRGLRFSRTSDSKYNVEVGFECTPLIPIPGRLRQADPCESETSLVQVVCPRSPRVTP